MSENFIIEQKQQFCIITLTKILNLDELKQVLIDVHQNCDYRRRLWSLSGLFNYSSEDIRVLAEQAKSLWSENSRVALLGSDDLAFGLLRMFEVFREADNFETKVFRDKDEAIHWLKSWEHE